MMWRFIPLTYNNAALNMAIDEAVSEGISSRTSAPTIRLYGWLPSAVSIGCFQSLREEVDVEECERWGVDYVRRTTGGGAVYHDHEGEITYSVIAPETAMPPDITEGYRTICGKVVDALGILGLDAEFHPINDILVGGKKISGSAQTRRNGVFLQHGTVLHDLNAERMFALLRVPKAKMTDKMITQARDRVTCVKDHSSASLQDLHAALLTAFTQGIEFFEGGLSADEMKRAETIARERYSRESWNASR